MHPTLATNENAWDAGKFWKIIFYCLLVMEAYRLFIKCSSWRCSWTWRQVLLLWRLFDIWTDERNRSADLEEVSNSEIKDHAWLFVSKISNGKSPSFFATSFTFTRAISSFVTSINRPPSTLSSPSLSQRGQKLYFPLTSTLGEALSSTITLWKRKIWMWAHHMLQHFPGCLWCQPLQDRGLWRQCKTLGDDLH